MQTAFPPGSAIPYSTNWTPLSPERHVHRRRKAVEVGDGIAVSQAKGSENNDPFHMCGGRVEKETNHAGGILGGISDGSRILLRAHIKPTPSIFSEQQTVTRDGEELTIRIKGRHDPVIVPRAVVVVEAMTSLVLADALLSNMTARLDRIRDSMGYEQPTKISALIRCAFVDAPDRSGFSIFKFQRNKLFQSNFMMVSSTRFAQASISSRVTFPSRRASSTASGSPAPIFRSFPALISLY